VFDIIDHDCPAKVYRCSQNTSKVTLTIKKEEVHEVMGDGVRLFVPGEIVFSCSGSSGGMFIIMFI
jgi:hypothetical protein